MPRPATTRGLQSRQAHLKEQRAKSRKQKAESLGWRPEATSFLLPFALCSLDFAILLQAKMELDLPGRRD
jgi:hypothetical protein